MFREKPYSWGAITCLHAFLRVPRNTPRVWRSSSGFASWQSPYIYGPRCAQKRLRPKKPAQPPPTQHVCHFLLPLSAPLQGLEVGDRSPILGTALAHLQVQTCIARHLRKGESAAGQSLELWPLTCTSDACTGEVCVLLTCLRRCYFRGFLAGWDVRPPQNSVHLIQS